MFLFIILISTILCNSSSLSSNCISSPLYIYNNNNSLINLNFLPNTSTTSFSSISFKYIPNETKLTFNNSFTPIHIDSIYPLLTNLFYFQINSFNFNSTSIIYNLYPNKPIISNDDLSISCRLDIIILYCYISCSTCINNEIGNENDNKCISCNEGYSFIENKPNQCIQSNSNGTELDNYFYHLGSNTYYECSPSNVDIYYKCLNCKKDNLYFYNNKCNSFNELPINVYVSDPLYNKVNLCYYTCSKCDEYGDNEYHHCLSCNNGYEMYDNDGNCYKKCAYGEGLKKKNNTCYYCADYNEYYFPTNIQCINNILEGYYVIDNALNVLEKCHENCATCLSKGNDMNNQCISCKYEKSILNEGNCLINECPYYLVLDTLSNKCINCKENGKILYKGECSLNETIPKGTVMKMKEYNYVIDCYKTCNECYNEGTEMNHNCLSCKNGAYYLTPEGNCVTQCNSFTVLNESIRKCVYCIDEKLYMNNDGYCKDSCLNDNKYNLNMVQYSSFNNICEDTTQQENNFICFNNGVFNSTLSKCQCNSNYKGKACQIKIIDSDNSTLNNQLSLRIKHLDNDSIISANKTNSFKCVLFNNSNNNEIDIDKNFHKYIVSWIITPSLNHNDIYTGLNDLILKLKPNIIDSNLKLTSILTLDTFTSLSTEIEISFLSLNSNNFDVTISFNDSIIYAYETLITIQIKPLIKGIFKYVYKYKTPFGYYIPIKESKFDTFGIYRGFCPFTNELVIEIIDNYEQRIEKILILENVQIRNKLNFDIDVNTLFEMDLLYEKDNICQFGIEFANSLTLRRIPLTKIELYSMTNVIHKLLNGPSYNDKYCSLFISIEILNILISNTKLYVKGGRDYKDIIVKLINSSLNDILSQERILRIDELNALSKLIDLLLINNFSYNEKNDILVKEMLKNLNKCYSHIMNPGELIRINMKNYTNIIIKPSINQKSIIIKYNNEADSFTYLNSKIIDTNDCDISNDLFCINNNDYIKFINDLRYLKKYNRKTFSINIIFLNNRKISSFKTLYKTKDKIIQIVPSTIDIFLLSGNDYNLHKTNELISSFKYSISFPVENITLFNHEIQTCSILSDNISTCKTYFNYELDRIICKYDNPSEIAIIESSTISNYYKQLQFPYISLPNFNHFSLIFIIVSFMLFSSFTIGTLYCDISYDNTLILQLNTTHKEILRKTFSSHLDIVQYSNIFELGFYIFIHMFPAFNIFYIHDRYCPRYLRFHFEFISQLAIIVLSILPYYFYVFTYKESFINKRDIYQIAIDVNNLPSQSIDIIYSLCYCIVASLIINIIIFILSKIIHYDTLVDDIWQKEKNQIAQYSTKYIVIDHVQKSGKFRKLMTRFKAVNMFITIHSKIKENIDNNTELNFQDANNYSFALPLDCIFNEVQSSHRSINANETECLNKPNTNNNDQYHQRSSSDLSCNSNNGMCINSCLNYGNYNKYQNNETPKKDNKNILISNSSDKHLNFFSPPLSKSHLYNNSALISSTINESKRILSLSVNPNPQIHPFTLIDSECIKSNKICIKRNNCLFVISSSIGMIIMLSLIYMFIWFVFGEVYNKYGYYIVKVWLIPVMVWILLGRVICCYCLMLLKVFIIRNSIMKKIKRNWIKKIFRLLIPKYIFDVIQIQKYLCKYKKYY